MHGQVREGASDRRNVRVATTEHRRSVGVAWKSLALCDTPGSEYTVSWGPGGTACVRIVNDEPTCVIQTNRITFSRRRRRQSVDMLELRSKYCPVAYHLAAFLFTGMLFVGSGVIKR